MPSTNPKIVTKLPYDEMDIKVDFAEVLGAAIIASPPVVSATKTADNSDATSSIVGAVSLDSTSQVCIIRLKGGSAEDVYRIDVKVVVSDTQKRQSWFDLVIEDVGVED